MRITSARDSLYYAAVDDDDDFDDSEEIPDERPPIARKYKDEDLSKSLGLLEKDPYKFERQMGVLGLIGGDELKDDPVRRQLIGAKNMPDGSVVVHQITDPSAPSLKPGADINARGNWQVTRWRFHPDFFKQRRFDPSLDLSSVDPHSPQVIDFKTSQHPDYPDAALRYRANSDQDKFEEAGWRRTDNPDDEEYVYDWPKMDPRDFPLRLRAKYINDSRDLYYHPGDEKHRPLTADAGWMVTAERGRRNPDGSPRWDQVGGFKIHPELEDAINVARGRSTYR